MKRIFSRHGFSALASAMALLFSFRVAAQVLEAPQYYSLPLAEGVTVDDLDGLPFTMDSGVIAGFNSQIGDVPLNDVAIMGDRTSTSQALPAGGSVTSGRVWSLVHTSASDTRALEIATPVDIIMSQDCTQYYDFPTSVQILDLTGDNINDLAFMGPCFEEVAFTPEFQVLGIEGSANSPFQIANSMTELGTQLGGTDFPIPFGGQLALVNADFNGDGLTDLATYNFNTNDFSNSLQSLLNNGGLGLLPNEISFIDGPINPSTPAVFGILLTAGDFDGNGTQDVAVAFRNYSGTDVNELQIYSGNGDGTFAQAPMAQANLFAGTEGLNPEGLTSGDFDGNDFADFAVSWQGDLPQNFISVVLCSSEGCSVNNLSFNDTSYPTILVSDDFDGDGQDDLANVLVIAPLLKGFSADAEVQVRLNQGGSFNSTPDQSLTLNLAGFDNSGIPQLVAKDIDACGGPDIAFIGYTFNQLIAQGGISEADYQAAVAFNPNEAPVANAGEPTQVEGGVQVGGTTGNPTCSDPTDDTMEISWTVLSGEATLNNSTVANPIVTEASNNAVLQVTCTDPCGESATSTVTIPATGFIQGSCTSLTGVASVPFNLTWLMIPAALGFMGAVRRKKS